MTTILRRLPILVLPVVLACLAGCATHFTGDAKVPGGVHGCEKVCSSRGMELAGMVVMGEYSDGCICRRPAASASNDGDEALLYVGAAGASGAVAGVETQRQRNANNDTNQRR